MKSSLEKINTANTKRLELLEIKYEQMIRFIIMKAIFDLIESTILRKACIFCKKNKYKKKILEKLIQYLEFRAADSVKKSRNIKKLFYDVIENIHKKLRIYQPLVLNLNLLVELIFIRTWS